MIRDCDHLGAIQTIRQVVHSVLAESSCLLSMSVIVEKETYYSGTTELENENMKKISGCLSRCSNFYGVVSV